MDRAKKIELILIIILLSAGAIYGYLDSPWISTKEKAELMESIEEFELRRNTYDVGPISIYFNGKMYGKEEKDGKTVYYLKLREEVYFLNEATGEIELYSGSNCLAVVKTTRRDGVLVTTQITYPNEDLSNLERIFPKRVVRKYLNSSSNGALINVGNSWKKEAREKAEAELKGIVKDN